MIEWLKKHKTEIALSISIGITAVSAGCAAFGITSGDIFGSKVTNVQSAPLGFNADGMTVNEVTGAIIASDQAEYLRRQGWDSARTAVVTTHNLDIKRTSDWDAFGVEVGGQVATAALAGVSGLSIAGVGVGGLASTFLALVLGRKNENKAWDEAAATTRRDLLTNIA